jgi:hypothetical protein
VATRYAGAYRFRVADGPATQRPLLGYVSVPLRVKWFAGEAIWRG